MRSCPTMSRILKYGIVLLIVDANMINLWVLANDMSTVEDSFDANKVVPDVVPRAPTSLATVKYPSGVEVNLGNELSPKSVEDQPTITWDSEPDNYYTVAMIDPDALSRKAPILRELKHWLVGNVPGDNVDDGEELATYLAPSPPPASGLHRYVFLVYKQPGKLTFDEHKITSTSVTERAKFSIAKFAEKYKMGDPIAGNFFQAKFDLSL